MSKAPKIPVTGNAPVFNTSLNSNPKQDMVKVAKETLEMIPFIFKELEEWGDAPRASMLIDDDERICPPLDKSSPYYPNLTTYVKVVLEDTLDAALSLSNMSQFLESQDQTPVCILNFANQFHIGGGFYSGSIAQEEDICRRSTLIDTLHPHFYPMNDDECIYSPSVYVFRENARKNHKVMWTDRVRILPEVSVISLAAECRPQLNRAGNDYASSSSRELMEKKMRLVLRVAANAYHRRIVLGALGCGAFGHPPQIVARLWLDVLSEEEFDGWFETVMFAVWDPRPPHQNFADFYNILHDKTLWQDNESSTDATSESESESESESSEDDSDEELEGANSARGEEKEEDGGEEDDGDGDEDDDDDGDEMEVDGRPPADDHQVAREAKEKQ